MRRTRSTCSTESLIEPGLIPGDTQTETVEEQNQQNDTRSMLTASINNNGTSINDDENVHTQNSSRSVNHEYSITSQSYESDHQDPSPIQSSDRQNFRRSSLTLSRRPSTSSFIDKLKDKFGNAKNHQHSSTHRLSSRETSNNRSSPIISSLTRRLSLSIKRHISSASLGSNKQEISLLKRALSTPLTNTLPPSAEDSFAHFYKSSFTLMTPLNTLPFHHIHHDFYCLAMFSSDNLNETPANATQSVCYLCQKIFLINARQYGTLVMRLQISYDKILGLGKSTWCGADTGIWILLSPDKDQENSIRKIELVNVWDRDKVYVILVKLWHSQEVQQEIKGKDNQDIHRELLIPEINLPKHTRRVSATNIIPIDLQPTKSYSCPMGHEHFTDEIIESDVEHCVPWDFYKNGQDGLDQLLFLNVNSGSIQMLKECSDWILAKTDITFPKDEKNDEAVEQLNYLMQVMFCLRLSSTPCNTISTHLSLTACTNAPLLMQHVYYEYVEALKQKVSQWLLQVQFDSNEKFPKESRSIDMIQQSTLAGEGAGYSFSLVEELKEPLLMWIMHKRWMAMTLTLVMGLSLLIFMWGILKYLVIKTFQIMGFPINQQHENAYSVHRELLFLKQAARVSYKTLLDRVRQARLVLLDLQEE